MEIIQETHGKPWIEVDGKILYFVEPVYKGWCLYRDKPHKNKKSFKEIIREVFCKESTQ